MAMTYFDGEAAGHAGLDFAAPQHEPDDVVVAQCPVAAEGMGLSPSLHCSEHCVAAYPIFLNASVSLSGETFAGL